MLKYARLQHTVLNIMNLVYNGLQTVQEARHKDRKDWKTNMGGARGEVGI